MGCRREAKHEQAGLRVSEAGHGPAPVDGVPMTGHLGPSHLLAPLDQTRATTAGGDVSDEIAEAIVAHRSAGSSAKESW